MTVYKYFGIIRGILVSSFLQADSPEEKKKKENDCTGAPGTGKASSPQPVTGEFGW